MTVECSRRRGQGVDGKECQTFDEAVVAEIEPSNEADAGKLVPAHFAYPIGSRIERADGLLAPYYRSLRLLHFSRPPVWSFTDASTSLLALDCQSIDDTVSFEDFARIFEEAAASSSSR